MVWCIDGRVLHSIQPQYTQLMNEVFSTGVEFSLTIGLMLVLYVLPGWGFMCWIWPAKNRPWGERLGLAAELEPCPLSHHHAVDLSTWPASWAARGLGTERRRAGDVALVVHPPSATLA